MTVQAQLNSRSGSPGYRSARSRDSGDNGVMVAQAIKDAQMGPVVLLVTLAAFGREKDK